MRKLSQLGERLDFPAIARLMTAAIENPDLLSLAAGFTDNRTLPLGELAGIAGELAVQENPEVLQYGPNAGRIGLRQWVAERLDRLDGVPDGTTDPDWVVVTNGSQQALHLVASVLCDPGDIILVEQPTYFVFLEALKGLGISALGIPTLADGGPDLDGLASLLSHLRAEGSAKRVRALYLVSYHANPSARSLSDREKSGLARVLKEADLPIPVIEDAAYRELGYNGAPGARSIVRLPAFEGMPLMVLGTFTKTYATGLKVGHMVCTDSLIRSKVLHLKGHQDFGTSNYAQALVEVAVFAGRYDVHLDVIRRTYASKCSTLDGQLRACGLREAGWSWERPVGGLYLWLRAPGGMDTGFSSELYRRSNEAGVIYVPGDLCYPPGGATDRVRLSFGVLDESRLEQAGQRFVRAALAGRGR